MSKKKQLQLKEELKQFLIQAFKHAKEKNIPRDKFAMWLHTKNIALKETVFHKETFIPHIKVEYLDNNKIREFVYDLTELDGRTGQEIWNEIVGQDKNEV